MAQFAIIDCGVGNLRSVQKIFERLGAEAVITSDPSEITGCDGIVLPGVGAFGNAMVKLEANGCADLIRNLSGVSNKPLLGICLGMQLLGHSSAENPGVKGLGLIPGNTVAIEIADKIDWIGRKLTLPHIGWNNVKLKGSSQLFEGLEQEADFYFVHSYQLEIDDHEWISATVDYGDEIICAIDHDNICATQFHPEKSQMQGQRLIQNFISRTERVKKANCDK